MNRAKLTLFIAVIVVAILDVIAWSVWPGRTAKEFRGRVERGEFSRVDEMLPPDTRWLTIVVLPDDLQLEPCTMQDWIYGRRRFREFALLDKTYCNLSVQRGKLVCTRGPRTKSSKDESDSSRSLTTRLHRAEGWLQKATASMPSNVALVEELYQRILHRSPNGDDLRRSQRHIESQPNRAEGAEDVVYELFNDAEFLHPEKGKK